MFLVYIEKKFLKNFKICGIRPRAKKKKEFNNDYSFYLHQNHVILSHLYAKFFLAFSYLSKRVSRCVGTKFL